VHFKTQKILALSIVVNETALHFISIAGWEPMRISYKYNVQNILKCKKIAKK